MTDVTEAPWPLLSEVARLFCDGGNPRQAFNDLLTSGQVEVSGKRNPQRLNERIAGGRVRLNAERIEGLLSGANQISRVEVSIDPHANEITIAINVGTLKWLSYSDVLRASEELHRTQAAFKFLGLEPPVCNSVRFRDVRVRRASLAGAAAAAGYRLPNRKKGKPPPKKSAVNRRGPKPGAIRRFGEYDRALFPEIERLMRCDNLSDREAAMRLAAEQKVKGRGGIEARGRRLTAFYRAEHKPRN